ncbi:MAG: hypothetical protein ORN50_06765, partial [Crocinitomicaceae bacterium]|nr:hypothetical protein [Crocinitomicaceae bacterium]
NSLKCFLNRVNFFIYHSKTRSFIYLKTVLLIPNLPDGLALIAAEILLLWRLLRKLAMTDCSGKQDWLLKKL